MPVVPFQRPHAPALAEIARYYERSERAGWFTRGPCVAELGERAAALAGGGHGVPVSSATVGIMVALRALAAGRASGATLVALPSFTCAAMAGAVVWSGYSPLFVDVEPDGWHLDPVALDRALACRPGAVAAILASATFGTPPTFEQADAWGRIAAAHSVPLIYDAAAGLGAAPPLGQVTAYSFEATKPAGFGEGGVLVTGDEALAGELRRLINYGLAGGRLTGPVGLNGKLSELSAAAALAVLDGLEQGLGARRGAGRGLAERLAGLPVRLQRGWETAPWSVTALAMASPAARAAGLVAAGELAVEVRTLWDPPLHRDPQWPAGASAGGLPATERLAARMLTLPMAPDLSENELDRLIEVVHRAAA